MHGIFLQSLIVLIESCVRTFVQLTLVRSVVLEELDNLEIVRLRVPAPKRQFLIHVSWRWALEKMIAQPMVIYITHVATVAGSCQKLKTKNNKQTRKESISVL